MKFLPKEAKNDVKPKSMEPFISLPGNEVSCGQSGAFNQYVLVYEVVKGEYELTKKPEYQIEAHGAGKDVLYYMKWENLSGNITLKMDMMKLKHFIPNWIIGGNTGSD